MIVNKIDTILEYVEDIVKQVETSYVQTKYTKDMLIHYWEGKKYFDEMTCVKMNGYVIEIKKDQNN